MMSISQNGKSAKRAATITNRILHRKLLTSDHGHHSGGSSIRGILSGTENDIVAHMIKEFRLL